MWLKEAWSFFDTKCNFIPTCLDLPRNEIKLWDPLHRALKNTIALPDISSSANMILSLLLIISKSWQMPFRSRAVLRITHLGSCQLLHSKQSILWPAGNDFCSDDGVDDRGEREFPFPVIPGNTNLKFPFPWHFVISLPVPGKRKFWPGIKTGNTISICSFADG